MQAQVTTLGFSGTLVGYANPSTVVQLTGGCFCFHEVDRNAQSHWPQNSKNPIDCACVHRRGGVLAYCEAEPGAPVIVVPIRVLTPVGKVNPETTAECAALSFSDDGHRLLTVHGPPDAWAALWSWRKGKCIASNRIRKECIGVGASVCPGSRSTSACVGESEACLMRHRPKRHGSALEILPVDGLPQRQSEAGVEKAGKLSEKLTSHCWLPGPDLLLASDGGSLFRVPARPDAAVRVNAQRVASVHAGIMDVDLLGPNVACAGSDGSVTILSASSFETRQSLSVGWGFAQSLAVSPSHNSLCVGTSSGRLVSFSAIDDEEDVNDPSLWQAPAEEGQDQDRSSKSRNASWRPGVDLDQQITRSKLLQAGHNAKVIGAGHVTNATVATVSSDGIVCFWSQDEEESLGLESMHTLLINSHVTVSAVGNGIIVIGTSDGCVRLYELGSNGDLAAGFQKIVHDGVVEEMAFDTGSGMIGTSGSDGSIAVISAQDGADSAFVRAILSAKNHPTCLAWCASGNKLAAGTESSEVEVHTFKGIKAASRASASGRSTIVHSLGLPTPPLAMTVRRNDGKLHAVGADCRVYEFTEASEEAEKVSEKLPGGGTPVGITCTGRVLTVGRETGEITTIDSGGLSLQGTWRLFGSTMPCVSSRVSTVVGLSNGSTVVCGEDGLIHMVITLQARKGHLRPPSLDVTTEPRPATSVSDPERFEAREDAAERQRIAQEREKNAEYFRKRCRELADRLSAAIEENTQADEYQQLPPEELVVDTSRYHALLEQGRKTAEEERRRSLEESLKQDLLRERIKQATKDRMERLGFEVKPFRQSPRRLFAESLRKRSEWEKQRARRVCFLRRVEKEEWSARGLPCLTQLAREQQGGGGNEMESSRGAKASESVGLSSTTIQDDLYSPVELHMPWRRLAQVVILKELQLTNKENFDKECEKLRDRKQDDLERMQEKRQRLQQIAEQMGWKEREREVADAIEEGWQAWRECQDETKEDVRSKDERENAQISMGEREQRALDEMMGGTLERSKLDEQAERLWQHEPWMDKPREEMSEEELAKLKEYEERLAEYEEEREKRRKSLEFEYRQLQSEIDTIAKNFDVQWWETYLSQQQHHRSIALMDLQALDLTIMTIDLYRLSSSVSELNSSVSSLRIARDTLVHTLEQLRKEEEQAKASAEQAHHELKGVEKMFRREYSDYVEFYDALLKAFKNSTAPSWSRRKGRGSDAGMGGRRSSHERRRSSMNTSRMESTRQSGAPRQTAEGADEEDETGEVTGSSHLEFLHPMAAADPFNEGRKPQQHEDQPFTHDDKPAGLDTEVWEWVMQARDNRLAKEEELTKNQAWQQELLTELGVAEGEERHLRERQVAGEEECQVKWEQAKDSLYNALMVVEMKQGRVEVAQSPMGMFEKAALIERGIVENLNDEIRKRGMDKVRVLERRKSVRQGIIKLEWMNKEADMKIEDISDRMKELQLLRLTKDLQAKLREPAPEQRQAQDEQRLQQRIQEKHRAHSRKLQLKRRTLDRARSYISSLRSQNEQLESRLSELHSSSSLRSRMADRTANEGAVPEHDRKVKHVRTMHKLTDISRQQAKEKEALQAELERWRKRTRPTLPPESGLPPI